MSSHNDKSAPAMTPQAFTTLAKVLADLDIDHGARDSSQCKCLTKYLKELRTGSLVVEHDYADAGFLSDYAGYYAACHEAPYKLTRRLHFFRHKPEELSEQWRSSLAAPTANASAEAIADGYVGFIVLKPLTSTVIGRTCLEAYPELDEKTRRKRVFPILRTYKVNLYGLPLTVESVAFQEQDREIAACATAAIWSTMHALPAKFTVHQIPSPFEITNTGWDGRIQPLEGEIARKFPSSGLDVKQIIGCLRKHGIEASVFAVPPTEKCSSLLENIAAFLPGGYPLLLVSTLYTKDRHETKLVRRGLHASTILGYAHQDDFSPGPWSARVKRLFIHDDTLGPFTSFGIETCDEGKFPTLVGDDESLDAEAIRKRLVDPAAGLAKLEERVTAYLTNTSGEDEYGIVNSCIVPGYLIIPSHPKHHLPYSTARDLTAQLLDFYHLGAAREFVQGWPELCWSIRLLDVTAFKSEIRSLSWLDASQIESVVCKSQPRLVWIIDFAAREVAAGPEQTVMSLVLDATALQQTGGVAEVLVSQRSEFAKTVLAILVSNTRAYVDRIADRSRRVDRMDSHVEACLLRLNEKLLQLVKVG